MSETYQFTWGELKAIEEAILIARGITDDILFTHIETKDFDLDTDGIGVRIRLPHNQELDRERKEI